MGKPMSIEIKATFIGLAAAVCVLAGTFGLAQVLQSNNAVVAKVASQTKSSPAQISAPVGEEAQIGYKLFERNCAHCHGDDARGDEGPDLHNLTWSDARIARRIREGLKGEMPKFGSKLNEQDIHALIAYLRTLKD
jgi:mono/diheme cytochrome c family protein